MKRTKTEKSMIGQIAHCQNCNFQEEWFKIAQRKAREHVLKTGHVVVIETTMSGLCRLV